MKIVTMKRLQRAYRDVRCEMSRIGIWTRAMANVEVRLVPVGVALGWKWDGIRGHVDIPAVSASRLAHRFLDLGAYQSLRHVVRHELGHALADVHRRALIERGAFLRTYGGRYDDRSRPYAERPCERFADSFALYVRTLSRRPDARGVAGVSAMEWRFLAGLRARLRRLNRRVPGVPA